MNPISSDEQAPFLPAAGGIADPVGFVAPAILQSDHSPELKQALLATAAELLNNPIAMRLFCDRVYQLLQDDLQIQKERVHSYGRS